MVLLRILNKIKGTSGRVMKNTSLKAGFLSGICLDCPEYPGQTTYPVE